MTNIIITGAAGFIGFHLSQKLLAEGYSVIGIDNMNDYYDRTLKESRLSLLISNQNFSFYKIDISDKTDINKLISHFEKSIVIHLAAQAGVRHSLTHPYSYGESNLIGFLNILEICRQSGSQRLIYASSSSVYGGNTKIPFSVEDSVDRPISLYAATKRANELMAYSYSHLYNMHTIGLRFFTVYGPWGRPDMAYYSFTNAIINEKPIKVFNHGKLKRDFTYIDDITESISRLIKVPRNDNHTYELFNIGNHKPIALEEFISILENETGKKAVKEYVPMQPGDVLETYADIEPLVKRIHYRPQINISEGLKRFVEWYKNYNGSYDK